MPAQSRVHAGIPAGGQFAATDRAESAVELARDAEKAARRARIAAELRAAAEEVLAKHPTAEYVTVPYGVHDYMSLGIITDGEMQELDRDEEFAVRHQLTNEHIDFDDYALGAAVPRKVVSSWSNMIAVDGFDLHLRRAITGPLSDEERTLLLSEEGREDDFDPTFSLVTADGTACPEFTLCTEHFLTHRTEHVLNALRDKLRSPASTDNASGDWAVSTENTQVGCTVCAIGFNDY